MRRSAVGQSVRGRNAVGGRFAIVAMAVVACGLASGCVEERRARLVQLAGCGLDGEEINGIVIQLRGDIPAANAAQLVLGDEQGKLEDLPSGVSGITVEGRFGTQVEAVGRTARLDLEGELPVYFSPPDLMCPVESDITPREFGAIALGPEGDVLIVGGRGLDGELSDEILHYRDVDGELTRVAGTLALPSVGLTVHSTGRRSFLVVGGASTAELAAASVWQVDIGGSPRNATVSKGIAIDVAGAEKRAAYHAGVSLPDGRILITGGCRIVAAGECVLGFASVQRDTFVIDPSGGRVRFERSPPLMVERFDHDLLVAPDGVVFAVGGRDADGLGVRAVEVLLPGLDAWAPYGPALFETLDGRDIVGGALLEGGLVILTLSDGAVVRVDQHHVAMLPRWCAAPEDACFPTAVDTFPAEHRMLVLPGERVLADSFLLSVAFLGADGTRALDLTQAKVGSAFDPPGPRVAAVRRLLDDGSVLIVGGRSPASGGVASPAAVLRFRPALDGPDEETPNIAALEAGSFVVHDVDAGEQPRISSVGGVLVLEPDPARGNETVATWAHVRGFRSRRFAFEATLEAQREARPRFVFSRGAIARTVIAVEPDRVFVQTREGDGQGLDIECSTRGIDFGGVGKSVRIDVSPDFIEVRSDGEQIARCPWAGDDAVAVGIGAVGEGTIRASGLGLSRG